MFTWECPKCGREIDIAESECPNCSQKAKTASTAVATEKPPAPRVPPPAAAPTPAQPATPRPRPQQAAPAGSWGLQGKHIAIFGLLAVVAIAAAIFFARPDLFRSSPPFEDPPLAEGSGDSGSAYLGDIEVAGVRTSYDEDYNPKVNAVVINHGDAAQASVNLLVELRTREASTSDTPLASFEIELDEALGPREARDLQFDLKAMGTLASLPPWHEMRVDLKQP